MDGRKFSTKNIKFLQANNSFKDEDINDCISYVIEKYCSHGDKLTEANKICLELADLDISGSFKEKMASMEMSSLENKVTKCVADTSQEMSSLESEATKCVADSLQEMSSLESEATKCVADSSQEIEVLGGHVSEIYEFIKESKRKSCLLEGNSVAEKVDKTLHIRSVNPIQSVLENTYNRNKRHTQVKGKKKRSRKILSYVQKKEGISNYKRMEKAKLKFHPPFLSYVQKKRDIAGYGTKTTKETIQSRVSTLSSVQKNLGNSNNAANTIEEIELNNSFEQKKQDVTNYEIQRVEEEIKSYSSAVDSEQDRQCISDSAEKAKKYEIALNDCIFESEPDKNVSNSEAETFEEAITSYTKTISSVRNRQDTSNYETKAMETETELNEIISVSEENEPGSTNYRTEAMEEEITSFSPTVSSKQNIEGITKYGDISMEEEIQLDTAHSSEQEEQNVTNYGTKAMEKRIEAYSATVSFEHNGQVSPNYGTKSMQGIELNNSLLSSEQKKQSITNYLTNALEEEIESCSSTVSSVHVIQTPEISKTRKLKSTIKQLSKRKRTNNPFEKEEIIYKKNKPSYNRNKYDKFRNAPYSVIKNKQPIDSRKRYSSSMLSYNSCDRNARGGISYSTKLSAVKNRDTIPHTYSRAETAPEPEDIEEAVTSSILSVNSSYLVSRDEISKLCGAPNKYNKFQSYPSTVTSKKRKDGEFSSMLSCNSTLLNARNKHPSLTKSANEQNKSNSVLNYPFDETTVESEYIRQEDDSSVASSNSSFFADRNAISSPKSFFNKITHNIDENRESNSEEVSLGSNGATSPNDNILQENTTCQKYENFHVTVSLQALSSNQDDSGNCVKIVPNTSRQFLFRIQEPATETIEDANALEDVSFHIIEWRTGWLKIQKRSNTFPKICKLKSVKHRYRSFREYVDTYYGLYLMGIWINLYESWMNPTTLFYANLMFYIKKEYYFENICNALLPIGDIPKCHGVLLLTCSTVKGGEQSLFGYIHNIQVEDALAPLHRLGIWKQVKITFYTSEKIMIRNSSLKMQQLCNVRDQYKQFHALQSFKSSMREVIIDPQHFEQDIEKVTISPMCSPGQLQQHVHKILDCALSPDNRFTLVLQPTYSDSVLTILELIRNMPKRGTLLVCLRNADKCLNVADVLKNLKTNFLLAVKLTEVYVPRTLRKYLLCQYALDLDDRRNKAEKAEVLRKSEVILTVLPFSYLNDCKKTVFGSNLTCIIDDAHFYTEVETALPLSYEPKNIILLGNSKFSLQLHPLLQSRGYQVSLFHRLFEGKKIL